MLGEHGLDFRRLVAARCQESGQFGAALGDGLGRRVGSPLGLGHVEQNVAVFLVGDFGERLSDELGRHLFRPQLVDYFQPAPLLVAQLGRYIGAGIAAFVNEPLVDETGVAPQSHSFFRTEVRHCSSLAQ